MINNTNTKSNLGSGTNTSGNTSIEYNEKTGFYTIDAVSLHHSSKRPFHLERRFNRYSNTSSMSMEEAEIKRKAILEERRKKMHQKFLKVKRIAKEMEDKRENKSNLLLKSMEIAEMNRNLHIERRRITSKNSVDRAKCIMLQNKKRSTEELERKKAELESRFQKTEQRRLAHLNRYKLQRRKNENTDNHSPSSPLSSTIMMMKTASLTTSDKHNDNNPIKVKKPSSWSILLKAFRELGLPSPSSPDTWLEFNTLGQLLHQPKVIVVTTKILNVALKITDSGSRYHARVLLTAYMTLMCPKEVLHDTKGMDEQRLLSSAKHMLYVFENWLKAHGRPGATIARMKFVDAWDRYNILFEAWKARDKDQLINNMIGYYIELYTLTQTMKDDVGTQLKEQVEQVKSKIEKLGGAEAMARLESTMANVRIQQRHDPRSRIDKEQEQSTDKNIDSTQLAHLLSDYSPASSGFTNEQLAHELIVNPEFKLQRQYNALEQQVKSIAEKAYFDNIKEEVEKGNAIRVLPPLINDIKKRLLSLVRPGNSMHTNIDEVIDMPLIEQQIRQDAFDMDRMTQFVVDCMTNMCAPIRDEEIKTLGDMNQLDRIQKILHLLEDMSLDLINFRLRALRPHLMSIAVEYEHETFAKKMQSNQLSRTRAWLTKSVNKLYEIAASRNPDNLAEHNNKPTHDAIFEDAFVSLIGQTELIQSEESLPETLGMDVNRMAEFQNEAQALTIVACLLMLARNFGSNQNTTLTELGSHLLTLLKSPTTSIDNLSAEIERNVNIKAENKHMVRTMVDKVLSQTDTVYCLLSRRVSSVIKSSIQNKVFVSDAVLTSYGLEDVRYPLQDLTHSIMRLCNHHRKVYSTWYDDIINEAIKERE